MRTILPPALLLILALALPGTAGETAEAEINYLLDFVSGSGCTFTRNGTDHQSADAADHLRLKYSRGKRWVDSAEDFIDRLASESSFSGEAYTATCDGNTEPSRDWLQRALQDYRKEAADPVEATPPGVPH